MASRREFRSVLIGLVLFSAAFGYVEAAVVIYLRSIYAPLRAHFYPATAGDLFPLLTLAQLRSLGPEHLVRLQIEVGREFATLLMLAGAALVAARNVRAWVAAFLLGFGVWDITFYLFLKLLIGWPASLFTWDVLFLIPVPWSGPVLAPMITAASMCASGGPLLWREYNKRPVHIGALAWSLIILGGVCVMSAFMWDFRNVGAGGNPRPFHWLLFSLGEIIGLFAFSSALQSRDASSNAGEETKFQR